MGWINNASFIFMGVNNFTSAAYAKASKRFDSSVLERDLKGRVCMVTGANAGLGLAVAKGLATRGCTLFMLCRSEERGKAAVEQVRHVSDNRDVHLRVCDISDLTAVNALAAELDTKQTRLYLLVNNAGTMVNVRQESKDGHELNFAVNTLGTFALTHRLQQCLQRGGPGSRVITVTSGGAYTSPLVTDDLEMTNAQPFDGMLQYARDKRRQIAIMERFAQHLQPRGVKCVLMHPGWVDTEGLQASMPQFRKAFESRLRTPEQGADTVLWQALQDANALESGALYLDRAVQCKHMFMAGTQYKQADVDVLWSKLCKLADIDDTAGHGG